MTTRVVSLLAFTIAALATSGVLMLRGGAQAELSKPPVPAVTPTHSARAIKTPPARGGRAHLVKLVPHVTLPVDSPWALPPMLVLQSRTGGHSTPGLRRWVMHLEHLALSPAARRSVRDGSASAGALKLLAAFPRTGGPLLVLSVKGRHIRAQETTLWMTRTALRGIPSLSPRLRPKRLLLEPVATDRIDLRGPPPAKAGQLKTLISIYRAAGSRYGIDWRVLAAINRIETNFGQNTHVSSAGAVGWMQFLPSTWRRWGTDASGDGVADPYDPEDAIFSAARYLDAAGARGDIRRAVFAYNHADWYVNDVLRMAAALPENYGA